MNSSVTGVSFHMSQLQSQVDLFEQSCKFIQTTGAHQCSLLPEDKAFQSVNIETSKLENAFRRVLDSIQATQHFMASGGSIKEGYEVEFLALKMDSKVREGFTRALDAMQEIDPAIEAKKIDILHGKKDGKEPHRFMFTTEGRGDLFVRGENALMRLPAKMSASIVKPVDFGGCEGAFLGERGRVPLTPVNNLWSAKLVLKDEQTPSFKYLVNDCLWSEGPNYQIKEESAIVHVPPFGKHFCSLLVPIKMGSGNKLALFGEGMMEVEGKRVELKWTQGVDFTCFGPTFGSCLLTWRGTIDCKIALVKKSGEIILEKGPNRKLRNGRRETDRPLNLALGPSKTESMQVASASLNSRLLESQESLIERVEDDKRQSESQIRVRQFPSLSNQRGRLFMDEEIISVSLLI